MKKKDLVSMFEHSTLKFDTEKKALYEKYYKDKIKIYLDTINDDVDIDIESLEEFDKKDEFNNFIRSASYDELEEKLLSMAIEVKYWAKSRNFRQGRRKRSVVSVIAISLIVLVTAVVAILSLVDNFYGEGSPFSGTIVGFIGILDTVFGVTFFVYEVISDRKVNESFDSFANGLSEEELEQEKQKVEQVMKVEGHVEEAEQSAKVEPRSETTQVMEATNVHGGVSCKQIVETTVENKKGRK